MATYQLWPPVTLNRIVQTMIYRLALHPLIATPPVWDDAGDPVKITKWRNYDGLELQSQDLTCSIFPYHFTRSDQASVPTVNTENTAVVFKPHTLGGGRGDMSACDEANAAFVVKLHAFGFSQEESSDAGLSPGTVTQFQFNYIEFLLRQYMELIAAALRSDEMRHLPALEDGRWLVANSFVHHIDCPTARWDKDANLILHSASLIWQCKYYVVRNWKRPDVWVTADMSDGIILLGQVPATVVGQTGADVGVVYDTIQHQYFWIQVTPAVPPATDATQALMPLDRLQLNDPAQSPQALYTTLDADMVGLIDSAPNGPFDFSLYFRRKGPRQSDNC